MDLYYWWKATEPKVKTKRSVRYLMHIWDQKGGKYFILNKTLNLGGCTVKHSLLNWTITANKVTERYHRSIYHRYKQVLIKKKNIAKMSELRVKKNGKLQTNQWQFSIILLCVNWSFSTVMFVGLVSQGRSKRVIILKS